MSDLATAPAHDAGQQAAPLRSLSAAEARTRLEAEAAAGTGAGEGRKAKALHLSAIETVECLFQPREIAEHHVSGMVKDLKAGCALPALLVYWTGARAADSCRSRPPKRDDVARCNGMMPPGITR